MEATSSSVPGDAFYALFWSTAMEGGSVIIPSSVKSIGDYAFASDTKVTSEGGASFYIGYLANVKILAEEPPTLGEKPFGEAYVRFTSTATNNNVKTIEVPKGCGDIYKAAEGWSHYADKIVEAS